jgi:hypothetical protein
MTPEEQLAARFGAFVDDAGDGDWADVRRRARTPVGRTVLLAGLAAALTVAVAAPALGLHRTVIDWFEAEPAPERIQLDFARLGVGAPPGMAPGVIPNSARKVVEVRHDGKVHVLWVAPTEAGGFCHRWTQLGGGCRRERTPPPMTPRLRLGLDAWAIGASWTADERGVVTRVDGNLLAEETERLVVEYADGEEAEIPVVWVSPPIAAGFYMFWVPAEHQGPGRHAVALRAEDVNGELVARHPFPPLTRPGDIERPVTLPDGNVVRLPARADVEGARKLFDFRAENGQPVWVWVIPTRDGGRCWAFNRGGGCPPADYVQEIPMAAGLASGDAPVLFQAQVRDEVAVVELRYEDGVVERLRPREGFVLHEIGSAHYERGHRLELAVALGPLGNELMRQPFRPDASAVYPCERPVDIGHGVMACP